MGNEKKLQVRIDGGEAFDISESDCRVRENNLTLVWNALRTGKLVTISGDSVRSASCICWGCIATVVRWHSL